MDCEEFRQAIAADPRGGHDAMAEHTAGCTACRALAAEVAALDERIARALAIEVPALALPDLPALRAAPDADVPGGRGRRRLAPPAWLALAAGIGAVLLFTLRGLSPGDAYNQLASEVLAHMDHEAPSRVVTTLAVSDSTLGEVLDPRVRALDTGGSIVSYATSCVINGNVVPHLVVQGRTGPITLILLPDEDVNEAVTLSGENVHGVILPADTGSVAIIGQRAEQMPEVADVGRRVVQSVKWSI